jgi:hypothetical protein
MRVSDIKTEGCEEGCLGFEFFITHSSPLGSARGEP